MIICDPKDTLDIKDLESEAYHAHDIKCHS